MSITPITASAPACFGVCCPQHASCTRYAAAEGPAGATAIATCDDNGDGSRPLYWEDKAKSEPIPSASTS